MTRRLTIKLNGKYSGRERFGLNESPLPVRSCGEGPLAALEKYPIPTDFPNLHIAQTLHGFSPEFQTLCMSQYRPGEFVEFDVTWEE